MEALERLYGKVKERKPLAWVYPVAGGRMTADAQAMVRFQYGFGETWPGHRGHHIR